MISSLSRRTSIVLAAVALAACHRGVTVSSPAPSGSGAATKATSTMPAGVTAAMIAEGDSIFAKASCTRCHGPKGVGANNGPALNDATWVQIDGSYPAIVKLIHDGVPKASVKGTFPFAMRPMGGGTFTEAQISSIAAYVYSLSHK